MKKSGAEQPNLEGRVLARLLAEDLAKISGAALARCVETPAPDGQFADDEIVTDPTAYLADAGIVAPGDS